MTDSISQYIEVSSLTLVPKTILYRRKQELISGIEKIIDGVSEESLRKFRNTQMVERIYLVGADPFVLSAERLEERASLIRKYLPAVKTITMYARVRNIMNKSDDDLFRLRDAGIYDLYVGTECGLDDVLERLNKGNSVDDARTQCLCLNMAGINHRDLLMLGTTGKGRGKESALASAKLENEPP